MPDDKTKLGERDRSRVAADQDYEVQHFAETHDLSPQQVRDLIALRQQPREVGESSPTPPSQGLMSCQGNRVTWLEVLKATAALLIAFALFVYAGHGLLHAYGSGYQAGITPTPHACLARPMPFQSMQSPCLQESWPLWRAAGCRLT